MERAAIGAHACESRPLAVEGGNLATRRHNRPNHPSARSRFTAALIRDEVRERLREVP